MFVCGVFTSECVQDTDLHTSSVNTFVLTRVVVMCMCSDDDENPTSAQLTRSKQSDTRRCVQRMGQRGTPDRSRSPLRAPRSSEPWKTDMDPDTAPIISGFQPRRTPGVQTDTISSFSPKDLFLLYFCTDTVRTLCTNTNKNAAKNKQLGKKYKWTEVTPEDLYKFFGLLMYTSLVSLPSLQDYWRHNHILSVPLPAKVMSRDVFRSIFWCMHLSDPDEDVKNDELKGTPQHDKLFRLRPLYDSIRSACQAYYHPRRELSVDERLVARKAKTGMTQYMEDKPNKWGIKLFVLTEPSSGYTLNFNLYTGKTQKSSEHGVSYDAVMDLIQPSYLGTGYHIYMDDFYTSPKLFMDLAKMNFGACGTFRENRKGCPRGRANALTRKCERGAMRWIREGSLVFVKWLDTREVSVCSTIHPAFTGETVQRRMKSEDGTWTVRPITCPTPIVAYNKNMGGVELKDQHIQDYSTHRRTAHWYRTMMLHFLDIAATNAFILHCEISKSKQLRSMTHKDFMVKLVSQLCGIDKTGVPLNRSAEHVPVPIATVTESKQKASKGRLKCVHCSMNRKRNDTPWKCKACDVPLCLVPDRNCYMEWHK